jgi:hypothetical protein
MPYYLELLINPVLQFVGISPEVLEPGERKFFVKEIQLEGWSRYRVE